MRLNFQEEYAFWYFRLPPLPFPMVPITLINTKNGLSARTYALLDSGADVSMFHANWARAIGADLRSGRPGSIGGVALNSGVPCYYHRIRLRVGSVEVPCEVAFSDEMSDELESQLVGRQEVFDAMRFGLRQGIRKLYVGGSP